MTWLVLATLVAAFILGYLLAGVGGGFLGAILVTMVTAAIIAHDQRRHP